MGFVKANVKIPARDESLLARAPTIPGGLASYDLIAPGLYPDETVVRLDEGDLVAVSVESRRQVNGSGVEFFAWARLIEEDGSTQLDSHGQDIETIVPFAADSAIIERHGIDALSRELMLVVMGEPPTMVEVEVRADRAAFAEGQDIHAVEWSDPAQAQAPMIAWSEHFRLNVSIRNAKQVAAKAGPTTNPGSILFKKG